MVTPDFLSSMTATEIRYLRGNYYFIITCEHTGDTAGLLPLFILVSDVCLVLPQGLFLQLQALGLYWVTLKQSYEFFLLLTCEFFGALYIDLSRELVHAF